MWRPVPFSEPAPAWLRDYPALADTQSDEVRAPVVPEVVEASGLDGMEEGTGVLFKKLQKQGRFDGTKLARSPQEKNPALDALAKKLALHLERSQRVTVTKRNVKMFVQDLMSKRGIPCL